MHVCHWAIYCYYIQVPKRSMCLFGMLLFFYSPCEHHANQWDALLMMGPPPCDFLSFHGSHVLRPEAGNLGCDIQAPQCPLFWCFTVRKTHPAERQASLQSCLCFTVTYLKPKRVTSLLKRMLSDLADWHVHSTSHVDGSGNIYLCSAKFHIRKSSHLTWRLKISPHRFHNGFKLVKFAVLTNRKWLG